MILIFFGFDSIVTYPKFTFPLRCSSISVAGHFLSLFSAFSSAGLDCEIFYGMQQTETLAEYWSFEGLV